MNVTPVRGLRRGRMVTTCYIAQVGELDGYGATPANARTAAMTNAEQALSGTYQPLLIRYGVHSAFVWREPSGWHYRHFESTELRNNITEPLFGTATSEYDRDVMERRVRYQIAQFAYDPVLDCAVPEPGKRHDYTELFDFIDKKDRRDLAQWIGFQRAYQAIKARIQPEAWIESTGHDYACNHANDYAPAVPA